MNETTLNWAPQVQTDSAALYLNPPSQPAKILVVDDEEEIRELIRETLQVGNFEVLESATGEEAWKTILDNPPDLVLLDILLPGKMDGLEVCSRMKTYPVSRDIPVIFITAVPLSQLNGKEMKAEGVFIKPFSPIELLDQVFRTLGRADA
ncbi:MAG TPA: response regulator [Bacteroidetes bacterium]|nr:response regulator [Bacteroidota bacterium]